MSRLKPTAWSDSDKFTEAIQALKVPFCLIVTLVVTVKAFSKMRKYLAKHTLETYVPCGNLPPHVNSAHWRLNYYLRDQLVWKTMFHGRLIKFNLFRWWQYSPSLAFKQNLILPFPLCTMGTHKQYTKVGTSLHIRLNPLMEGHKVHYLRAHGGWITMNVQSQWA